jgi:hypothetical protein
MADGRQRRNAACPAVPLFKVGMASHSVQAMRHPPTSSADRGAGTIFPNFDFIDA